MRDAERSLESEVNEFAEDWVGRWNDHDVEGILGLVTEDVVWEDPSIDGQATGAGAARAYIENLFSAFPDIRWSMPESLFVSLDRDTKVLEIGQPWNCRGTLLGRLDPPGFAPTGRQFDLEGMDLWSLDRELGRLLRVVSHYDGLEFARRTGLMPARGSRSEQLVLRLQRIQAALGRRAAA